MKRLDELLGLQRRVQISRELTDALILEVLERCSPRDIDTIPQKYVLLDLCNNGFWEQAALWVLPWINPRWNLALKLDSDSKVWVVQLTSPLFLVSRSGPILGRALIEALVEANVLAERVGADDR